MLEIALLAPLTIKLDGQPLKLPSRRTEALVVYLLRNPQPHAREVLANLLWDDLPQNKALGNLRVLLANLRKALDPYVTITRQSAAWNGASDYRVDLTTLEDLLALSRSEIDRTGALTKATAATLGAALQHYQGDLLPGFYLHDGQGFEEWLATEREWLWTRAVQALDDLATEYLQWGDYRAGVEQAQRLVDLDPLREEGHQLLMQLWAADGQISAALAQYERCVHLLEQELGVPPHPFTTELYERMRRGDWRLPRPLAETGTVAAASATKALPHNLPRRMAPIWGRATELAQLATHLGDPTMPLITILGPGGIGKTLLAMEAARALITAPRLPTGENDERLPFQDGIYLVALAPLREAAAIAPAIAAVIGCRFQPTGGDETTQLLGYLRSRSMLLLLDNVEHLLDETEIFGAITTAAPQVQLLVTSRHKLNRAGETVLLLTGLDYPQATITPEPDDAQSVGERLLHYSAVRLFVEHVRRAHGNLSLGDADLPAVGQICRLAQGMPLAILLAAAWVELLSPAEIAVEIEQNVAFLRLETGRRVRESGAAGQGEADPAIDPQGDEWPERQRTMHAIFEYSWQLLTRDEQQILARLSIFRGGCTRLVAQQVTDGSLRDLLSLVHKSLLTRHAATGRFTIHELLRQLAAEKLHALGQAPAPLHQRAVTTIEAAYAHELAPYYGELAVHAEQGELLDKARHYRQLAGDRARDGYQNELALEEYGHALRLTPLTEPAAAFHLHMERQAITHRLGRRSEQAQALAALMELAHRLEDDRKVSEVLICQARYAEALGHYGDAAAAAQAAVALAEAAHADDLLALGNLAWGVALGRDNAFAAAHERLETAVRLAEAANLPQIAADSLRNLGIDAAYQNQNDLAQRYFAESLAIYRQLGDRPAEAAGLGNLAVLALRQCDYQGAQPYLAEALAIFRQIGDLRSETISLNNLGVIAHKLGEHAAAEQHFTQALRATQQTDDQQSRREAHSLLGHLLSDQARYDEAQAHYAAALPLAQALNVPGHVVETQVGLAALALADGNAAGAYRLLNPVLAAINESTLAQADDTLRIYWRAYQILIANHDAQADTLLAVAHQQLQRLAAQLTDEAARQSFLQDVSMHQEIIAAFEQRSMKLADR